jgi:uncharacterized protein
MLKKFLEKFMQKNPVGWFEIYVQDMNRAKKFYEAVLGCELTPLPIENKDQWPDIEMLAFPMNMGGEGASGALVKMSGAPSGFAGTLIYFSCDDCSVNESKATTAGGNVKLPKTSIGQYGYISLIFDTEGNLFGLHSTNYGKIV